MGPRTDSIPPQGGPGGQRIGSGGGRPGIPLQDRPNPLNDSQGRSSAPPGAAQMRPPAASPTPSITTPGSAPIGGPAAAEAKPKPKPSPGPATFEQMGIPKVKKEDDCVSFLMHCIFPCLSVFSLFR